MKVTSIVPALLFILLGLPALQAGEPEEYAEVPVLSMDEETPLVLGVWREIDINDLDEGIKDLIRVRYTKEVSKLSETSEWQIEEFYQTELIWEKAWLQPVQGQKLLIMYQEQETISLFREGAYTHTRFSMGRPTLALAIVLKDPDGSLALIQKYRGKEVFDFIGRLLGGNIL
jgi:hypothetical protein